MVNGSQNDNTYEIPAVNSRNKAGNSDAFFSFTTLTTIAPVTTCVIGDSGMSALEQ